MTPSKIEETYQELLLIARYYKVKVIDYPHGKQDVIGCFNTGITFTKGKFHRAPWIYLDRPIEKNIYLLAVFAHELGHAIIRNEWPDKEYADRSMAYADLAGKRQEEHLAWLHADNLAEKLGFYNDIYLVRRAWSLSSYGIYTK